MVPESVSSLLGSEASEGPLVVPPQRGDDDSLSAESMDSVHGEESLCPSVSSVRHCPHLPVNENKWMFCPMCVCVSC